MHARAGVRDLLVADDADRASWLLRVCALGMLWPAGRCRQPLRALVGRPAVMAALRDTLDASGADPGLLTLEITRRR